MRRSNRIMLPLGVFLLTLVASLALTGYFQKKGPKEVKEEVHPLPEIFEFSFRDSKNNKLNFNSISEDYKLIYFGTIHGSEISPQTFSTMRDILDYKFRYPLQPIFITLDPRRDSTDIIESTLNSYDSNILGLIGKSEEVERLSKSFGVRSQRTELPSSQLEYTIDQSPWMYLTTPDFRILGAYPTQIRKERLKMEIDAHMKRKR